MPRSVQVWKWICSKRMTSKFDFILDVYCSRLLGHRTANHPLLLFSSRLSSLPSLCEESSSTIPTQEERVGKKIEHPQLLPPIPIELGHSIQTYGREGSKYLSFKLVRRPVLRPLPMNLPVFIHDKPKGPDTSSRFIGVIFGMLREGLVSSCLGQRLTKRNQSVCFLFLLTTFLWWRRLYPSLQGLVKWLRDKARAYIPRCA